MIISFDIPNPKATRLSAALDRQGYVFDPELGTTDNQQREAFIKRKTIDFWRGWVEVSELEAARAAATAGISVDFSDVA